MPDPQYDYPVYPGAPISVGPSPLADLEHRIRMLEADRLNQVNQDVTPRFRIKQFTDEGVRRLLDLHDCQTLADLDRLIGRLKEHLAYWMMRAETELPRGEFERQKDQAPHG